MLTFLFISYLLSGIGYLIYIAFIKNRVSLKAQKNSLHFILLACFAIPFLVHSYLNANPGKTQETKLIQEEFVQVCDNFCPDEEEINLCYDVAITTSDFCNCATVEKENLIVYHSNTYYNFFVYNVDTMRKAVLLTCILFAIILMVKIISLQYIIFISDKRNVTIDGEQYIILEPNINLPVASFRLFKKYIIWEASLNQLNKQEQAAIMYHEIAHIKNFDTWWKIIENVLITVWLVNPVYYLICKDFKKLSEFIADEYAVHKTQNKKFYASLLLKMQRQYLTLKKPAPLVHAFRATSGKSLLKARIEKIILQPSLKSGYVEFGLGLLLGLYILVSSCAFNFINYECKKIEVYQTLSNQHHNTGYTVFCKQCLSKNQ